MKLLWTKNILDYNKGIILGLQSMLSKLRQGGLLLIKDPVMPLLQEAKIGLTYTGRNSAQTHRNEDISHWDYLTRVMYFLKYFPYFNNISTSIVGEKIFCESIGVSEIIRHTSSAICNTIQHFSDELLEWYGSWNARSWSQYISNNCTSVKLLTHRTIWNPSNHASNFYYFFEFSWENGDKITCPQKYFPTHQFTILQKI